MDTRHVEKTSVTRSRKAYLGLGLGLTLVVALAVVVRFAHRPSQITNATVTATEYIAPSTQDKTVNGAVAASLPAPAAAFPRELVAMEATGAVNLARPVAVSRELVELEAAGLVTLARRAAPPLAAARPAFPRELVEMEAAGLINVARPLATLPQPLPTQRDGPY